MTNELSMTGRPVGDTDERTDDAIRNRIVDDLERARRRTHLLTGSLDDTELARQHSRLMSPLVWDLAHIGNQEELWLLRDVGGRDPILPETVDQLYDAFQHPRADRPALPLLDPAESRRYVGEVRTKVIDLLDKIPLHGRRLTEGGFVFGMIAQHEQQHAETMLATHQLRVGDPVLSAPPTPAPTEVDRFEVLVPGGPFTMGTSAHPWALDNERPAHQVEVPSFWMDTVPVTNVDYQDFIADGGYQQRRWWHPAGWQHVREAGLTAPLFWQLDGRQWLRRRFGRLEPVPAKEPVMHVCWYEADAYARWAGKRLPTEAEWEKAARHDPVSGADRQYPWGDGDPTVRAGQPRSGPSATGSGRRLPGGGLTARHPAVDRRCLGVDVQRLRRLPGLLPVAVPGVLGGVLLPGLQGAAWWVVRRRSGRLPRHVPELGLPDPPADLRRFPVRPRRGR